MDQPSPDTADWTWVLQRQCPDCGYDAPSFDRSELGAKVRSSAASWRQLLGRGDLVSERPPVPAGVEPRWSAVEYGAHCRDVWRLFGGRFEQMLRDDNPVFRNWDQNAAAIDEQYHLADSRTVAYELAVAAGKVADLLDHLDDNEWERTGGRSDGPQFTIESMARYGLHDVVHHLWDAEQGLTALS